jgi:hypothetical protein
MLRTGDARDADVVMAPPLRHADTLVMRARRIVLVLAVLALAAPAVVLAARSGGGLSATWIGYSARIDYDNGSFSTMPAGTQRLVIGGSRWRFGSSSGTVKVSPIAAADWTRWGISPYGPTRKATFAGWNHGKADGPLEEEPGRVDFIWILYRAKPPVVHAPGLVSLKFGRLGN